MKAENGENPKSEYKQKNFPIDFPINMKYFFIAISALRSSRADPWNIFLILGN